MLSTLATWLQPLQRQRHTSTCASCKDANWSGHVWTLTHTHLRCKCDLRKTHMAWPASGVSLKVPSVCQTGNRSLGRYWKEPSLRRISSCTSCKFAISPIVGGCHGSSFDDDGWETRLPASSRTFPIRSIALPGDATVFSVQYSTTRMHNTCHRNLCMIELKAKG